MKTEDSRLEKFRQLRKKIRGSEWHFIVGIDIGKQKHNAFLETATGPLFPERTSFLMRNYKSRDRFFSSCSFEIVFFINEFYEGGNLLFK